MSQSITLKGRKTKPMVQEDAGLCITIIQRHQFLLSYFRTPTDGLAEIYPMISHTAICLFEVQSTVQLTLVL